MDSSSPHIWSSPPLFRHPSSAKRPAQQDESSVALNQHNRLAQQDRNSVTLNPQFLSEMYASFSILTPPQIAPPPPPLPHFLKGRQAIALSGTFDPGFHNTLRVLCIPKETVDLWDRLFLKSCDTDVTISTDDGSSFEAHSLVLIPSSPILRNLIEMQQARKGYKIAMTGVPFDAARAFVRFLYSSRYDDTDLEKYIIHLLVLSHIYGIPTLKKLCTHHLEQGLLTVENVIDVFQLARLCDVPRLNLMCLRVIIKDFKIVAKTEGWRVMQESNPSLEQELVEAVIEADFKRQEKLRKREEDKVYAQLQDAMEALVHICRDGYHTMCSHDKTFDKSQHHPCNLTACKGMKFLVRHFAECKTRGSAGCMDCKRMWQLLKLHSRMCQDNDGCKVPLCSFIVLGICWMDVPLNQIFYCFTSCNGPNNIVE